jgi:N utilization substance protein A
MGQRVRNVVAELHGEKIDIIDWAPDLATYVGNALSPAHALRSEIVDPNTSAVRVIVPDFQLSLAIGREGQNARLAARLTGARIDIHSDAEGQQRDRRDGADAAETAGADGGAPTGASGMPSEAAAGQTAAAE